jgi:copper(I)-binding protein
MRIFFYRKLFIGFVFIFTLVSQAHATSELIVNDGYVRASIPGSNVTAAYMTINNKSNKAVTLQKVSGIISDRIEIHEHTMTDGMMRMGEVDEITIKASSKVTLQPSGLHLMIFALKQKITEQDMIALTLHFSDKTKVNIQLPVYRYK